ncbi:MAG: hypothetical protein LBH24_00180 [Clostridiales bacterium]|jgi:chorismate mutase/prephenate dehydratase|nr:hypothetical protein [Clostridiales bacterium]
MINVAYLGDESSHTYAAASALFSEARFTGAATVGGAAALLTDRAVDTAVIPIENSYGGTVAETLDALFAADAYIVRQHFMPISHALIGYEGANPSIIKRVYSHPQALAQCGVYIGQNLKDATLIPVKSTSEALGLIRGGEEAAIARGAGPGQAVLAAHIEDRKDNATRFIVLEAAPRFSGKNVSLMFEARHRPGALFSALRSLAENGVNLHKLESRPGRQSAFRYRFYLEFMTDADKKGVMRILNDLSARTELMKFLGMYE